jgi:hypothetical protein
MDDVNATADYGEGSFHIGVNQSDYSIYYRVKVVEAKRYRVIQDFAFTQGYIGEAILYFGMQNVDNSSMVFSVDMSGQWMLWRQLPNDEFETMAESRTSSPAQLGVPYRMEVSVDGNWIVLKINAIEVHRIRSSETPWGYVAFGAGSTVASATAPFEVTFNEFSIYEGA